VSRKAKSHGPSPFATVPVALPARQITRAQANELLKARALELYHNARTQRDEHIRAFEAEYGRADRVDHTVLADLQRTQAPQHSNGNYFCRDLTGSYVAKDCSTRHSVDEGKVRK